MPIPLQTRAVTVLTDDETSLVAGGADTRTSEDCPSNCCPSSDPSIGCVSEGCPSEACTVDC